MQPSGVYHVQHWYELEARAELAIYKGNALEALSGLDADIKKYDKSLLRRVVLVHSLKTSLHARLHLAAALEANSDLSHLKKSRVLMKKLSKTKLSYAIVCVALLKPAFSLQGGNKEQAIEELRQVVLLAEKHDMSLHGLVAQRRLGELLGGKKGDALVEKNNKLMEENGIKNPDRMSNLIAPGFNSAP